MPRGLLLLMASPEHDDPHEADEEQHGGHDGHGTHVAFAAHSRTDVDAFYKAAIAAGGRDNGAPGLRLHYHANYYGAFVLDPDGHNVEAVCHAAEG